MMREGRTKQVGSRGGRKHGALALLLCVGGLGSFAQPAFAQAGLFVPLQGYLTDADDKPIDGDQSLTFSLYTEDTGGTALFTETQLVTLEDGFFTAYVGDGASLDPSLFEENAVTYLGIQVGSEAEMSPRTLLASAPYAAYATFAGDAAMLGALAPEDYALVDHVHAWDEIADAPTYSAGLGLALDGDGEFSVNSSVVQLRGSTTSCTGDQVITAISATGDVTCTSYAVGDITSITGSTQIVVTNGAGGDVTLAINDNSITGTQLADNSVNTGEIAANAVGSSEIAMNAVGADEIAADAVGSSEIAADAVGSSEIAAGVVGTSEIQDNSVTSADILLDTIAAEDIAADAVGTSEIQDNSVTSADILLDTIAAVDIAADAVGSSEIAADAVGSSEIAADAVGSSEIAADAVTESEIATGAVGADEIAADAAGMSEVNLPIGNATIPTQALTTPPATHNMLATSPIRPTADGRCLVQASLLVTGAGTYSYIYGPVTLSLIMSAGGLTVGPMTATDGYYNFISYSPDRKPYLSASASYVFDVTSGVDTSFGCQVRTGNNIYLNGATARCTLTYLCL